MEFSIQRIEILLLIAAVVAMLARRMRLPYTVGLTVAGMALAAFHTRLSIPLSKELIFSAFLPPLIFEAAYHMQWKALRDDAAVILTLATVGIFFAAGIGVAGLHYLAGWPWSSSLLLGVLISATDPVSVIATFKEAGVHGRLRLLVESESLFNDGTVAVLYGVALAAAGGETFTFAGAAQNFCVVIAGGVLCGGVVGGGILLLAGRTEDHLVEITFSTVAAYGSFFAAEHLHFSGVLATLTTGVMIGNMGSMGAFSDRGREALVSFWEYVGFVANSLIFLLIGIRIAGEQIKSALAFSALLIVLTLLGRAAAVYACCALFRRSELRIEMKHQHVLFWGGLRGALALALAMGLPQNVPLRSLMVSVAFTVVAFSVIVQGVTMTPLLRRLGEIGPHEGEEEPKAH